jgi:hypothetical protein
MGVKVCVGGSAVGVRVCVGMRVKVRVGTRVRVLVRSGGSVGSGKQSGQQVGMAGGPSTMCVRVSWGDNAPALALTVNTLPDSKPRKNNNAKTALRFIITFPL